ncbi:MAG: class I SAM-dependent methyltransferase [Clostridia bacterium]|nr:class I SAM-dependent methyltransferase [Clostridia bacterium]
MSMADQQVVAGQYATAARLNTRISIHEKYSRNQQPFGAWVTAHYALQPGEQVLELGCGTGSMWRGVALPAGCHVTLTDHSAGMLDTARENTPHLAADYAVVDAQAIPYADATFDVVIANMMLYHVPDIARALREIRRVLKPGGRLIAATFGEHGVVQAVAVMLGMAFDANMRFTLQNGGAQLAEVFGDVQREVREDALDVTDVDDLIAYLRSMQQMTALADVPDERLRACFASHMRDGVLSLPKEYGLFLCR